MGALLGCGEVKNETPDAPAGSDAAVVDAAGCPRTLLVGGTMVEPQGWSIAMQPPASLSYGPDYVRLETSTMMGETSSGYVLLSYPGVLPAPPYRLQVVLLVERVSTHNSLDSAAAIMASYTPPLGMTSERSQMIYLDSGSIGWADDTQAFTASITNNAYHTVELAVNASAAAQVNIDGVPALMRDGFVSNGVIAIGDQTNDAAVDSAIRIRSVTLLCP